MNKEQAILLAKEIVRLDILRDEMWEKLLSIAGYQAHELLRNVQNGWGDSYNDPKAL